MFSPGSQIAQCCELTIMPLAEEKLSLLAALLSLCIGLVAMLVVAAIERATPHIYDWIRGQIARASQVRPPQTQRPYPPILDQRDG